MPPATLVIVSVCALVCACSKADSSVVKREDNQSNASSTRRQVSSSNPSKGNLYYYYYPVQEKKRQSVGDYETSASNYNPVSAPYDSNLGENLGASSVYQGAASNQNAALYGGQGAGFGGVNGFTGGDFGGVGAASDISQVNPGGYGGLAAPTGGYGVNSVPAQTAAGVYGLGTPSGISQLTAAGYGGGGLGVAGGPGLNQFVPGGYGTGFTQAGGYGGNGAGSGYGQFGVPGGFGGYGQGNYGGHGDLRPSASSAIGSFSAEPQSALGWGSLIMPILALAGLGLLLPSVSSSLTSSSRRKRDTQEKMDVFSGYRNKLEKYYAIYRSAVENEQCLNRVICELGNSMSNDKIEIISNLEKFMPEKIKNKMEIFVTGASSTKVNKCYKYKC
ncbi:spidroin-1-like isoform X2 [Limulus polyphemus]|nr:spidroin-1-like isoform X2 [Limulus polyphemus]